MVRTIKLDYITKIEGHASLTLKIEKSKVKLCHLEAIEGARFFEHLVRNHKYDQVQEIVSRICGICSCSHSVCSIQALENALNLKVSEQTRAIRELLMIGERIRSHVTHLYFLALPDYLGYESAIAMAKKYRKEINDSVRLMQLGNEIITVLSGREIHPLSMVVGGLSKIPLQNEVDELKKKLENSKKDFVKTARLFLKLKHPKYQNKVEYFSLKKPKEYAMIDGSLYSDSGYINTKNYKKHIKENIVEYATAKFALKDGKIFTTGALARINNNSKELSKDAKRLLKRIKLPITNPFYNNICQAIELIHLVDRAIFLLKNLKVKEEKIPKFNIHAGHGVAAVEAPRGVLFHEYKLDKNGLVKYCNIITPTVQNLNAMEQDIKNYLLSLLKKSDDKIVLEIEKLIRAYDPCFSCSAHFLKVKWL